MGKEDLKDKISRSRELDDAAMTYSKKLALDILAHRTKRAELPEDAPLLAACRIVAEASGVALPRTILLPEDSSSAFDCLKRIGAQAGFRVRPLLLEHDWWKENEFPMLGFDKASGTPLALIPDRKGNYALYDTEKKTEVKANAKTASGLAQTACMFYPALPEGILGIKDLLLAALARNWKNLWLILLMAFAAALLGMLSPLITKNIISKALIYDDIPFLAQLALALVAVIFITMIFDIVKVVALIRFDAQADFRVQSGIIDRMLRLPSSFFRRFSAGDLASRMLSIDAIVKTLTGMHINALLGGILSFTSLIMMFVYGGSLALVGLAVSFLAGLASFIFSIAQLRRLTEALYAEGRESGVGLQLITGISKIKTMALESRAFAQWTEIFCKARNASLKKLHLEKNERATVLAMNSAGMIFIYIGIAVLLKGKMDTGDFIAFLAAYKMFDHSFSGMFAAFSGILPVIVNYRRVKPILEEKLESSNSLKCPAFFKGNVALSSVFFRYGEDLPFILKNLSFNVSPGEFVAITGPSGSGKSTLTRLLLGLEFPETGSVLYDGQDLKGMDFHFLRSNIGVVLQNAQLMPGSILQNIVGASPKFTEEDAWKAAELAGIAEDIKAMPMQMQTVVSEGMECVSGGQKQRIIIARALVKKPSILIFDEATSALDNRSQDVVSKNIQALNITRIVVAHRLTTIKNADKIFFLKDGRFQESGNFDSLMKLDGDFARMARRQLL